MIEESKNEIIPNEPTFADRVVNINRVAKVVKGGRRFSFSALVVVGDGNGHVGYGLGKAAEVPEAIKKAAGRARKNMIQVPVVKESIPHDVIGRYGSARVLMRAAGPGTGVIAGGVSRAVFEAVGIHNILSKCLGTTNPHNVIKATFQGLQELRVTRFPEQRKKLIKEKLDSDTSKESHDALDVGTEENVDSGKNGEIVESSIAVE